MGYCVGQIVGLKPKKEHPLLPFAAGEPLRVTGVHRYKNDRVRIGVQAVRDAERQSQVWTSQIRRADYLEVDGVGKTLAEWGTQIGVSASTIKERLRFMPPDVAVTLAKGKRYKEEE